MLIYNPVSRELNRLEFSRSLNASRNDPLGVEWCRRQRCKEILALANMREQDAQTTFTPDEAEVEIGQTLDLCRLCGKCPMSTREKPTMRYLHAKQPD